MARRRRLARRQPPVRRRATDGRWGMTRLGLRSELSLGMVVYTGYTLARWLFAGEFAEARERARSTYALKQAARSEPENAADTRE